LSVRFLILSNELPRIADASGALASRFVVVMLENSFYGHEDHSLTNKLIAELPGILNWSLAGLKRLRERGRFKMPDSSLDAIRQLEDLGSPVAAFLRDWCEVGPLCEIETKEFYAAYAHWCEPEGHRPGSRSVFGRDLKAACPLLRSQQRRRHGGGEIDRFYIGVGLSEVGREQYETAMRSSLRRRSG
jgi:putative DNA primase/helicase